MRDPDVFTYVAVGGWYKELKSLIGSECISFHDGGTFGLFEADSYGFSSLKKMGLKPVKAPPGIYKHSGGESLVKKKGARIIPLESAEDQMPQNEFERFGEDHPPLD